VLVEYLQALTQRTVTELVAAQSELEAFRGLGKLDLLETLKNLENQVKVTLENAELAAKDEQAAKKEGWIN
jgi:predicted transcriptional regulator